MTRFDEDFSDARQYCEHGTFVGSWWGPDYMCGWCEDGVTVAEMVAAQAAGRLREAQQVVDEGVRCVEIVTGCMADAGLPYSARLAQGMVDNFLDGDCGRWVRAWNLLAAREIPAIGDRGFDHAAHWAAVDAEQVTS